MKGNIRREVAADLGSFLRKLREKKNATIENEEMRNIIREFVFTKAFCDDPTNRVLEKNSVIYEKAKSFRQNGNILAAIQQTRELLDKKECLCHGDLHAGSIMTNGDRNVLIDAEFAFVGPAVFDVAFLATGYIFTYATSSFFAKQNDAGLRRLNSKFALQDLLRHADVRDFIDLAPIAACELARRVLGAATVPDLSDLPPSHRDSAELFLLDLATTLLLRPPSDIPSFLSTLDDTFDASLLFAASRP